MADRERGAPSQWQQQHQYQYQQQSQPTGQRQQRPPNLGLLPAAASSDSVTSQPQQLSPTYAQAYGADGTGIAAMMPDALGAHASGSGSHNGSGSASSSARNGLPPNGGVIDANHHAAARAGALSGADVGLGADPHTGGTYAAFGSGATGNEDAEEDDAGAVLLYSGDGPDSAPVSAPSNYSAGSTAARFHSDSSEEHGLAYGHGLQRSDSASIPRAGPGVGMGAGIAGRARRQTAAGAGTGSGGAAMQMQASSSQEGSTTSGSRRRANTRGSRLGAQVARSVSPGPGAGPGADGVASSSAAARRGTPPSAAPLSLATSPGYLSAPGSGGVGADGGPSLQPPSPFSVNSAVSTPGSAGSFSTGYSQNQQPGELESFLPRKYHQPQQQSTQERSLPPAPYQQLSGQATNVMDEFDSRHRGEYQHYDDSLPEGVAAGLSTGASANASTRDSASFSMSSSAYNTPARPPPQQQQQQSGAGGSSNTSWNSSTRGSYPSGSGPSRVASLTSRWTGGSGSGTTGGGSGSYSAAGVGPNTALGFDARTQTSTTFNHTSTPSSGSNAVGAGGGGGLAGFGRNLGSAFGLRAGRRRKSTPEGGQSAQLEQRGASNSQNYPMRSSPVPPPTSSFLAAPDAADAGDSSARSSMTGSESATSDNEFERYEHARNGSFKSPARDSEWRPQADGRSLMKATSHGDLLGRAASAAHTSPRASRPVPARGSPTGGRLQRLAYNKPDSEQSSNWETRRESLTTSPPTAFARLSDGGNSAAGGLQRSPNSVSAPWQNRRLSSKSSEPVLSQESRSQRDRFSSSTQGGQGGRDSAYADGTWAGSSQYTPPRGMEPPLHSRAQEEYHLSYGSPHLASSSTYHPFSDRSARVDQSPDLGHPYALTGEADRPPPVEQQQGRAEPLSDAQIAELGAIPGRPAESLLNPDGTALNSKNILTIALQKAQNAVSLDGANNVPEAIAAYKQAVRLLQEVMERIAPKPGRKAKSNREEERRRLKVIHDTYADRIRLLSSIYSPDQSEGADGSTPDSMRGAEWQESPERYQPRVDDTPEQRQVPTSRDRTSGASEREIAAALHTDSEQRPAEVSMPAIAVHSNTPTTSSYREAEHQAQISREERASQSSLDDKSSKGAHLVAADPHSAGPLLTARSHAFGIDDELRTPATPYFDVMEEAAHSPTGMPEEAPGTEAPATPTAEPTTEKERLVRRSMSSPTLNNDVSKPLPIGTRLDDLSPQHLSGSSLKASPDRSSPLVSPSTLGGTISQRRRGHSMSRGADSSSRSSDLSPRDESPNLQAQTAEMARFESRQSNASSTADSDRSVSSSISGRQRALSQPARRPSLPAAFMAQNGSIVPPVPALPRQSRPSNISVPSYRLAPGDAPTSAISVGPDPALTARNASAARDNLFAIPLPSAGIASQASFAVDGITANPKWMILPGQSPQSSPNLAASLPSSVALRPLVLMRMLHLSISNNGFVSRRIHVSKMVWMQSTSKLQAVEAKLRAVELLEAAIESIAKAGDGLLRNPYQGQISPNQAATRLSTTLDELDGLMDEVQSTLSKKVASVPSISGRKGGSGFTNFSSKLSRSFGQMTNNSKKDIDNPVVYVESLGRLFGRCQLFERHLQAISSAQVTGLGLGMNEVSSTGSYGTVSNENRAAIEAKIRRTADFFASVILPWTLQDLAILTDRGLKRATAPLLE